MGSSQQRVSAMGCASLRCVIIALFAACGGDAADRSPRVSVVDSAGRLHVRMTTLQDLEAPRWTLREVYTTREGASGVELYHVTAARLLPDGGLAVANSGTTEIVVLDVDGGERARLGRSGDGPGEFRGINWLGTDRDGHLVAYDPRLGRLTTLDRNGVLLGTRRLDPPSRAVDLVPLAVLEDGRVLAIHGEARIFGAPGMTRDSTPLLVFDLDSTPSDTLGYWPAQEWYNAFLDRGATRAEVGFGRTLAWGGRDGYSVIGSTDSLDITVFDPRGRPVMSVAGVGARAPVEAADVDRWRADMAERRVRAPDVIRRALADTPHRETHPVFAALLLDDARRLWIGGHARPGETDRRWLVLGPTGDLVGAVDLPAQARLLDVAGDRVVVLSRDDLDQEHIAVLRLSTGDSEWTESEGR